jgi:redox-sensitive bicupin YhaK (pirin superfamily)
MTTTKKQVKKLLEVRRAPPMHWVGDGFPVRTLLSYAEAPERTSPFLLLDYACPRAFPPTDAQRGVGEHPHRGFETVTIAYQGEIAHRDSTGAGGTIGPGDVQWMTAGGGVVHEEFHSPAFSRRGGTLEMVQLWVNLPARDKLTPPRYQDLRAAAIPTVELAGGAGTARVIAGSSGGKRGPAHTFTPIELWDLVVEGGKPVDIALTAGHTAALLVRRGALACGGEKAAGMGELALFDAEGDVLRIEAQGKAELLLLAGRPIAEPIVGYGPFVMNSEAEIRQAIADFNGGRFGRITA